MGIRLSEEEVWEFVAGAHTGILTTLRRNGAPVSLPLWFATFDRTIWFRTPSRSMKVQRIRRDPRACFLVETGKAWRELKAVMMNGTVEIVAEDDVRRRVREDLARKYDGLGPNLDKAPDATRRHYGGGSAVLRFVPSDWISWDNARIRFSTASGEARGLQKGEKSNG